MGLQTVANQFLNMEQLEYWVANSRSEEHTSELQSHSDLVCRLLLEKKKTKKTQLLFKKTILTNVFPH